MKKLAFLVLSIIMLMGVVMSGCGNSADNNENATQEPTGSEVVGSFDDLE